MRVQKADAEALGELAVDVGCIRAGSGGRGAFVGIDFAASERLRVGAAELCVAQHVVDVCHDSHVGGLQPGGAGVGPVDPLAPDVR